MRDRVEELLASDSIEEMSEAELVHATIDLAYSLEFALEAAVALTRLPREFFLPPGPDERDQ